MQVSIKSLQVHFDKWPGVGIYCRWSTPAEALSCAVCDLGSKSRPFTLSLVAGLCHHKRKETVGSMSLWLPVTVA